MKKLILLVIMGIFLINLAYAVNYDVAYIITNTPEPGFINAMDDLGASYNIINYQEMNNPSFNFNNYRAILINNDYFVNWNKIPVNNKPSLIASSYHLSNWGWAVRSTVIANTQFIHADLNTSNRLAEDLPSNFQVYNSSWKEIYVLDKRDIYQGFEYAASSTFDSLDLAVGMIRNGTTLTKEGYPDTQVNANSVFFGFTKSDYWTSESEQLFKNSLLWLLGIEERPYDIYLQNGQNLVSFPISLTDKNVSDILEDNENIVSIREFDSSFISSSTIENNKGYFIKTNYPGTLTVEGFETRISQNINLKQGMNLVGLTSLSVRSFSSLNLPSQVTEVSKRNMDGSYTTSIRYASGWYPSFNLEPGKGYWFKSTGNANWTYTP